MWQGYRVSIFLALVAGVVVRDCAAVGVDACHDPEDDGDKEEGGGEGAQESVSQDLKKSNSCILAAAFPRFTQSQSNINSHVYLYGREDEQQNERQQKAQV